MPSAQATLQGTSLVFSAANGNEVRADAYVWQNEMRGDGFQLTVDGKFGEASAGVAALYSYLTKVSDGQPGVVGENIWKSTVQG